MHLLTPAHLCSGLRERSRVAAGADRLLRRRHRVFQRNHQPLDLRVRRICTLLHTCWCRSKNFENFFVREQRSLSHSLCRYIFRRLRWLGSRLLSHLIALLFLALWHGLYSGERDNIQFDAISDQKRVPSSHFAQVIWWHSCTSFS